MGSISMIWKRVKGVKVIMMMIAVQMVNAGVNIFYKLAANNDMSLSILIAYRSIFASALVLPLALVIERNRRPKLTWMILFQAFLSALFGSTMAQNLYAKTLVLTSATFAAAFANLVPAITFTIAVFCRLERAGLSTMAGKAKVIGTLMGIGGAMLLTFYKGQQINLWSTHFNLLDVGQHYKEIHMPSPHRRSINQISGFILALAFCFTNAIGLIFQAKLSTRYPCPYSSTALISLTGSIQAVVFALCTERKWSAWNLHLGISLITALYTGVLASGIMVIFIMYCVRMRGPLFVSIFNPLALVLIAISCSLVLDEKLHLGTILGSVIIIAGLYAVLWGKAEEIKRFSKLMPSTSSEDLNKKPKVDNPAAAAASVTVVGAGDLAPAIIATANEDVEVPVNHGRETQEGLEIVEEGEEEEEEEEKGEIFMVDLN